MFLSNIAVERFQIELELPKVLRLKLLDLQLDDHKAVEAAVEEEEIQREVPATDLNRVLRANEREVAPEFVDETTEVTKKAGVEIGLGVLLRKAEELQHVGISEHRFRARVKFSHHR